MSDHAAPQDSRRIPPVPLLLGLGGLIPFWGLALARVLSLPVANLSPALAAYAATILAFLGGIRWGASLGRADLNAGDYVLGVVPQLLGWGALALPDPWRFLALGLLILVLGPVDRNMVTRGLAPPWFGRLRVMLSLGAGAALFLAALA